MTRRAGSDEGQATVELALVLPVVAMLALGVVQVAVVAYRYVGLVHASREGARAAAVAERDRARDAMAREAVRRAGPGDGSSLEVDTTLDGRDVTVRVTTVDHTDVPLIGAFLPEVVLGASTTMRVEDDGGPSP